MSKFRKGNTIFCAVLFFLMLITCGMMDSESNVPMGILITENILLIISIMIERYYNRKEEDNVQDL